jgi:hypothetical protein
MSAAINDFKSYLSSIPRPSDARSVGLELDELMDQQFDKTRSEYERPKMRGNAFSGGQKKSSPETRRPHSTRSSSPDENDDDSRTFYEVAYVIKF